MIEIDTAAPICTEITSNSGRKYCGANSSCLLKHQDVAASYEWIVTN